MIDELEEEENGGDWIVVEGLWNWHDADMTSSAMKVGDNTKWQYTRHINRQKSN